MLSSLNCLIKKNLFSVCANIMYLPKDYGISLILKIDDHVILNETVSGIYHKIKSYFHFIKWTITILWQVINSTNYVYMHLYFWNFYIYICIYIFTVQDLKIRHKVIKAYLWGIPFCKSIFNLYKSKTNIVTYRAAGQKYPILIPTKYAECAWRFFLHFNKLQCHVTIKSNFVVISEMERDQAKQWKWSCKFLPFSKRV